MTLRTTLLAAAALFAMATTANAAAVTGQISLNGYAAASGSTGFSGATGIDFVAGPGGATGPADGTLTSFGAGTGSFAALSNCSNGNCGTIKDLLNFSSAVSSFLTLNSAPTVSFDITSFVAVSRDAATNTLSLVADGIIHFAGYDDTMGQFTLSAQGNQVNTFSATTLSTGTPTPEPASLAILGGSLAALGLLRRKKA